MLKGDLHDSVKGSRRSTGNQHNRYGSGEESEEGYVALCAGCEASKWNGTRPLRSLCSTS